MVIWDWQYQPHRAVFTDTDGNAVKSKFIQRGHYWAHNYFVYAIYCDIEPFSYKTYIIDENKPTSYRFESTSDPRIEAVKDNNIVLENDLVYAEFDRRTLKLITYKDKQANRNLIDEPSAYFRFINEDHRSSAWVIGSYMKIVDLHEEYNVRLVSSEIDKGGLASRFVYEIDFMSSHLKVTVALKENSRVLEFMTEIDWREQSNERVTPQIGFFAPLGYAVDKYRYDIPFGTIDRDGENDDRPANTFVAAIPENKNFGAAAVITDTRYGYRCVNDSIYLNLLHTSKNPDQHPETDKHTIRIGLLASENCDNESFYRESSAFIHPISYVANKPHGGKLPYGGSGLFSVEGKVKISAVKTPENEAEKNGNTLIIRLYDISGEDGKVSLKFADGIKTINSLDLNEVICQPDMSAAKNLITHGPHGEILSFDLVKHGVATIKVKF